ncbi:MAG: N-acetylmuramic acid 6-phosphate etherase [Rhodobacteraceae bacterium]|nr:N-acetylmuramic acid 6-phosphate etherase [Paracoccaceae bacterium]
MPHAQTEATHPRAESFDLLAEADILGTLLEGQIAGAIAVRSAVPALGRGAAAMVAALRRGGNLVYAAAGSSGLQCLADGLEIPPTFGIPSARIHILRAGGFDDLTEPKEGAEDDVDAATRDAAVIGAKDCVICMAASGNTIYPNTIMDIAKARGAITIGIANNPGTRLLEADIPVLLPTPPEVIAGSTRLGAGTAQKVALNLMSSLMGVKLGHVMNGLMVNVTTSNIKLRKRGENIVMEITGCDRAAAQAALERSGWRVKEAILLVSGAKDMAAATNALEMVEQNMRAAIANVRTG